MNLVYLQIAETVLSFSVFVGILLWAYNGRRKPAFDRLAELPFDDTPTHIDPSEHGHG